MKTITRICEILALGTLVFIWIFGAYLENNRPQQAVGNFIVQVPEHGDFIYISQTENLIRVLSWPLFFVLVVICLGLEAARRGRR